MSIVSNVNKWIDFHNNRLNYWSPLFMILFAIAFILSDWTYAGLTFADYILMFLFGAMFLIGQIRIGKNQFKLISIFVLLLMGSNIANYFLNEYYVSLPLQAVSTIRITFYIVMMFSLFNFIRNNKLEKRFLKINNIFAIVAIIIGVYITIAIYSDGVLPYEKIWTFTRQDHLSYLYYSNPSIVRTRSLFSEPAHLGYYLNAILALNLFNNTKKVNYYVVGLLLFGIMLTFSYSMIFVLGIILGMYVIKNIISRNIKWKNWYLVIIFSFIIFIYIFWDFIDATLIERTSSILTGEDSSAYNRLVESWQYIDPNRWWFGNGMGHTPPITNIYAYFLTDLGLFGFIPIVLFTLWLLIINFPIGLIFILFNFSRGGYLTPDFWLMITLFLIYSNKQLKKYRYLHGG